MHSNNTLTETDVVKANEKDIPGVGDSVRPGSEHSTTTDDSESDDVLWVDWEGRDDPANPKKCVSPSYHP